MQGVAGHLGLVPLAPGLALALTVQALGCLGGLAPCWLASFDLYHHHHNLAFFFLSNSSFSSSPTTHTYLHLSTSLLRHSSYLYSL